MKQDIKVNRNYKDRLFRFIFREPKELLALYNAMNGTNYQNPDELEINTLEDAIYLSMKNDVSFLIHGILNLYEHQSTWNLNYGKNQELMDKCHTLMEYSVFIDRIRTYQKQHQKIETAVRCAIEECIQENILSDILKKHRNEVSDMILTEYDEQAHIKKEKADFYLQKYWMKN